MNSSCLTCIHKDVCLKRSMFVFQYFIITGRYDEVENAQKTVDIGENCDNWEEQDG